MRCAKILSVAGLILCVFSAIPARAGEANYQSYLMGDRAAGMGGAACAIANGVDACYYNPSGLTRTKNLTLSVSASLYGIQKYKADSAFSPDEEFETDSFQTVPTTIGGTWRANTNMVLGFSVLVPQKSSFFQTQVFSEKKHYYNVSQDYQSMWIGPSAGYQLTPQLSIGASAFGTYQTYTYNLSAYGDTEQAALLRNMSMKNFGALGMLGLQFKPDDRWNIGVLFQTPCATFTSSGNFLEGSTAANDSQNNYVAYVDDLESKNIIPAKLTAGIAWSRPKDLSFELDCTYHLPTSDDLIAGQDQKGQDLTMRYRREGVVDVNAGVEYYLLKKYPLRAGFFTSNSSAPDADLRDEYRIDQVDLYGVTLSGGIESKNAAMNLGLSYAFGDGNTFGWREDDQGAVHEAIADASEQHLYAIFNTSYFF